MVWAGRCGDGQLWKNQPTMVSICLRRNPGPEFSLEAFCAVGRLGLLSSIVIVTQSCRRMK